MGAVDKMPNPLQASRYLDAPTTGGGCLDRGPRHDTVCLEQHLG